MTDDDLAREMAAAVLAGDEAAAYALADLLLECRASGKSLASVADDDGDVWDFTGVVKTVSPGRRIDWEYVRPIRRWTPERKAKLRAVMARAPKKFLWRARLGELWRIWEPSLNAQTAKVLEKLECVTPSEVAAKGKDHVGSTEGCGVRSMRQIEQLLARYGLRWSKP